MNRVVAGVCAWLVMGSAGCGSKSDGTGKSCGAASSCGGDIVGSWKITSSCFDFGPLEPNPESCPGITEEVTDSSMSGSVTYSADKTYQSSFTFSASLQMKVPASCLTQPSATTTCAQIQQNLEADT